MYERIIVPVDGSEFSERAIPYAVSLARMAKAPVTLVRVVDAFQTMPPVNALAPMAPLYRVNFGEETRQIQDYLEHLASDLRSSGLLVETACEIGPAVDSILAVVKPGDVIVISSHGRSGLRRAVLGSVAETILHRSKVPVLVVRAEPTSHDALMAAGAAPRTTAN
jgi:nucleotide-binding universal stress UspA family protein